MVSMAEKSRRTEYEKKLERKVMVGRTMKGFVGYDSKSFLKASSIGSFYNRGKNI